jgi:hypothetical protein
MTDTLAGTAAVIVAGFAAAMMFPIGQPLGRVLVVAVAAGLISVPATDWRAGAAVTVLAILVFVGFLTHRYGTLTGDPAPWSCTPVIGFAALAGRAAR